jgi:hypothetical protein
MRFRWHSLFSDLSVTDDYALHAHHKNWGKQNLCQRSRSPGQESNWELLEYKGMLITDYSVSSVTCLYVLPYKCCQHVIMCHPCYSFNWTSVSWNGQLVLPFCCPKMQGVIIASRQDPKLKNILHYSFKGNYLCQQTVSHCHI